MPTPSNRPRFGRPRRTFDLPPLVVPIRRTEAPDYPVKTPAPRPVSRSVVTAPVPAVRPLPATVPTVPEVRRPLPSFRPPAVTVRPYLPPPRPVLPSAAKVAVPTYRGPEVRVRTTLPVVPRVGPRSRTVLPAYPVQTPAPRPSLPSRPQVTVRASAPVPPKSVFPHVRTQVLPVRPPEVRVPARPLPIPAVRTPSDRVPTGLSVPRLPQTNLGPVRTSTGLGGMVTGGGTRGSGSGAVSLLKDLLAAVRDLSKKGRQGAQADDQSPSGPRSHQWSQVWEFPRPWAEDRRGSR